MLVVSVVRTYPLDDQGSLTYNWYSDVDGLLYSGSLSSFSADDLTRGEHEVTFYVTDIYGYNSTERNVGIRINHEPTINLVGPEPDVWVPDLEDGTVTFWWEASDDDSDSLTFKVYLPRAKPVADQMYSLLSPESKSASRSRVVASGFVNSALVSVTVVWESPGYSSSSKMTRTKGD